MFFHPHVTRSLSLSLSLFFFFMARQPPVGLASSFWMTFLDHTQRRTTFGRTPLDEWSARRRDPYLTTHNTHNRQTSMPPAGFEPTILAGKRPQTYALDRAATGTDTHTHTLSLSLSLSLSLLGPNILLTALLSQYANLGRFIENSTQDSHV